MKPNIDRLDDVDVVFLDRASSPEEDLEFSEWLKARKKLAVARAKRFLAAEAKRKLK